ncbi:MAG: extracellular solute-binding protein [Deltaproteobacteria bacterium]|nr:extracellular solute-binding protein [Deltaproteobacteria bacterium]
MIKVILLLSLFAMLISPAYAQDRPSPWLGKAREEGKVVFYTTMSVAEVNNMAKIFEKQQPSIKVELLRAGGSGAITNRVQREYSAKSYFVDVIQGVANRAMIPVFKDRGIIEKYDSPEYQFVPDDLKDKDRYWASVYQNTYVLVYNKNLVRKSEVPRTYDDLLRPQWKNRKLILDTEGFPWFNGLLSHWGREKGLAYFRKLAQQDPVFHRGSRLSIQLVMAGEAPLTMAYGSHAHDYVSKGAPIGWVTLQPVVFNVNSISLAKRAPHPNAAKLFIDFLFSKEAQTHLRAISHIPSRADVDANPPELFKGFQRIFAFRDSSDIPEIVRLYNETFRLAR